MFALDKFIAALQVSWIKRATYGTNDTWKLKLSQLTEGDVLNSDKITLNDSVGIALKNIIVSYKLFVTKFYQYKNNYLSDKIFANVRYGTGGNKETLFDEQFF
jgi:hypothetical protein